MAWQEGSTGHSHIATARNYRHLQPSPAHMAAWQRDRAGGGVWGRQRCHVPMGCGSREGDTLSAAPIHPVLQGPAVLPPRCPLPTGRLHQVDAQLDKCPRGVFLGGEGDSPSAAGGDRAADMGPRACTVLQLVRRGGAEGPQPLAVMRVSPAPGNNLSGTLQGGSQHG